MARSRTRASAIALVLAAGVTVAGCTTDSSKDNDTDTAASPSATETGAVWEGNVAVAMAGDVTSLDPHKATNAPDLMMARARFDTLVRRDNGGAVASGLAASWDATATSAAFTLRDSITCSDGTELTATDVAASLQRLADPASVVGQAFGAGNEPVITADDTANTVTVEIQQPYSDLLYGLSLPQTGVICPMGLSDSAKLAEGTQGIGTGPYYIDTKTAGSVYNLTASEGYEQFPGYEDLDGVEGTIPATVEMKVYQNESTMANDLATGALDFGGFTGPDAARFTDATKYTMTPSPLIRSFVAFNQRPGHPGADPAVRKAMAAAIDRAAFNQTVTKGTGVLMASLADPSVPCANKDESLLTSYDVDAAKSVLSGVKVNIVGTNAVAVGVGNEYLLQALKAAGADATLRQADNATWATDVLNNKGDWDVTIQPNLNLTNLLTTPASFSIGPDPAAGGRNYGGVQNAAFATAFGKAMAATDDSAKCAAWDEAQQALLANTDVVPLAAINVYYTTNKRISVLAPDGIYDGTTMRIVE